VQHLTIVFQWKNIVHCEVRAESLYVLWVNIG